MNNNLKYTVEIIKDAEQLTEALQLRYNIYKTAFPLLTAQHIQPYEWDEFDARSIHLGLYCNDDKQKRLAGYCRLVLPEFFINDFEGLLITNHVKYNKVISACNERMVFMKQLVNIGDKQKINSFCSKLEAENMPYVETSRFIIHDEHRSTLLSLFFVSGMIAACRFLNICYCFFACKCHHAAFYNKFGFEIYPGITPIDNETYGKQYLIFATDFTIAPSMQSSINNYQLQMERKNCIELKKAA